MKKLAMIFYIHVMLFILVGCGGHTSEPTTTYFSENDPTAELTEEPNNQTTSDLEESELDSADDNTSNDPIKSDSDRTSSDIVGKENNETLNQYSSEQIEYARVWLQLGPNQDIDSLYVRHISKGEPLNPNDDTSMTYPEDVIQLAGGRL